MFNFQYVSAEELNTDATIISEYTISDEFEVVTAEDEIVNITIEEELIDILDEESIEKIVEINPEVSEINIQSADSFAESTDIPEQVVIITDDELVVNVEVNSDVVENVSAEEILDIIEDNDLNQFETISINAVNEIEYEDDTIYSYEENGDSQSEIITAEEIQELEEDLEDETVTAEETQELEEELEDETVIGIEPQYKWYETIRTCTTSRTYGSQYVYKDVFIASAAKGETYTLTKSFSTSVELALEAGGVYSGISAKAGLTTKVTYSVEKKHQYEGPSSSLYNAREYRVKLYAKKCYVTQKVKGWPSKHISTFKATYRVPVKYISYSRDYRV